MSTKIGIQTEPEPYPSAPSGRSSPPQDYPRAGGYPPPKAQGYSAPDENQSPPESQQPNFRGKQSAPKEGWMILPTGPAANCPPGLECLTSIDQLLVRQKVEVLEVTVGIETPNKFSVKNSQGKKVFHAEEQSNCITRNIFGSKREFEMKIFDGGKKEVIYMKKPLDLSYFFSGYSQKMKVYAPPRTLLGTVEYDWGLFHQSFNVKNSAEETVLIIESPVNKFRLSYGAEFQVLSKDRSKVVGRISKQWSGLLREAFTDADYFGITFPMDLDVRMKAVMLGACFLIDALFFETCGNFLHQRGLSHSIKSRQILKQNQTLEQNQTEQS